tara:strand:+ start:1190 stop:2317 length:1128 start_codon:yes stop_codon:yes gene_type:complete
MEITVREVTKETKSTQELEKELLQKHEEKFENEEGSNEVEVVKEEILPETPAVEEVEEEKTPSSELNDEDVLSYIKNRYDKDISSVDDLFAQTKDNDELPEDVSAYLNFKKETGRGIEDFYKLQKDYDTMDDELLLADYYGQIEEGLDAIDIQDLMDDKFSYDEDLDDERSVKKIKLAKKRELAKAKKYFNEQKGKYKIPLESSGGGLSGTDKETFNAYKSYIEESTNAQEVSKKRYDWFLKKTDEVFNNEFKGFEFNVGEQSFTYKPGDAAELKNVQSDVNNFVNKFTDKDGLMNDAKGYHKSLAIAMNPEKFAQFFYDQGVSNTVDNVTKKSKNINMDIRQASQSVSKDGLKIRAVGDTSSGRGLKIRSIKKV